MMRWTLQAGLGVGLLLSAVATGAAAEPSSGTLVFATLLWEGKYSSHDVPGGVKRNVSAAAIYTIGTDGSNQQKVVDLGGDTTDPTFSPDGQWLYFQSNGIGEHYQVYRCRADGSEVTDLSAMHKLGAQWREAYGYALSGNGQKVVYIVHDGGVGRTVVADADGTDAKMVAPQLGYIYMGSLNSTGSRVVFSGPAREYRLLVVDLPDGEPKLITPDLPGSSTPHFTPDDQTIVFQRRDGIYLVGADGQDARRLLESNDSFRFYLSDEDKHGSSEFPDVSADGRQIAYVAGVDGVRQVHVMHLDGSQHRQITHRPTGCARVRWSPDGRQLAFISFEGDRPQLFVVDAEGGEAKQLTDIQGGCVYWVNWHP